MRFCAKAEEELISDAKNNKVKTDRKRIILSNEAPRAAAADLSGISSAAEGCCLRKTSAQENKMVYTQKNGNQL
jgi:hypothetical protein